MPLGPEFDKMIDSKFADMKNSAGRNGGSSTAAALLQRFVNDVPWSHLDIAGTGMCVTARPRSTAAGLRAGECACSTASCGITTRLEADAAGLSHLTEVLFYHLCGSRSRRCFPTLLEKSLERGWRAVVQATSEERLAALDDHLWTYRDEAFMPHGTDREAQAERQPVLLTLSPTQSQQGVDSLPGRGCGSLERGGSLRANGGALRRQ